MYLKIFRSVEYKFYRAENSRQWQKFQTQLIIYKYIININIYIKININISD